MVQERVASHTTNVSEMCDSFRIMDGELHLSVGEQLQEMANRMNPSDIRIAELEELCAPWDGSKVEMGIQGEFRKHLHAMRDGEQKSKTTFAADTRALTAVVGNLDTDSISEAQTWLADKLTVLKSPLPHLMYSKRDFGGTLFAKFRDQHQRDLAVTLLKSASIFNERKPMWAAPDTNPVERAARNFCFGLRRVFKVGSNIPHAVQVNESSPYTVPVGGKLALTAHISSGELVREWHGEWAHWQSLITGSLATVSAAPEGAIWGGGVVNLMFRHFDSALQINLLPT